MTRIDYRVAKLNEIFEVFVIEHCKVLIKHNSLRLSRLRCVKVKYYCVATSCNFFLFLTMLRRLTPDQAERLSTTMEEMEQTIQLLRREVALKTDELNNTEFQLREQRTQIDEIRTQTEERFHLLDLQKQELEEEQVQLMHRNNDLEKMLETKEVSERNWEREARKNEEKVELAEKIITSLKAQIAAGKITSNIVTAVSPVAEGSGSTGATLVSTPTTSRSNISSMLLTSGISSGHQ